MTGGSWLGQVRLRPTREFRLNLAYLLGSRGDTGAAMQVISHFSSPVLSRRNLAPHSELDSELCYSVKVLRSLESAPCFYFLTLMASGAHVRRWLR